ncbi:MAG: dihydroorotate dehydrogenase [Planctomycetota bacterium]|jgi:dihydroorotate dehydrogenase (NAD+) catalytic subunit
MRLNVNVGPLELRNPIIMASGTFGYGWEFEDFLDYGRVGGVIAKTVTLKPRKGNPPPRTCETPSGMLNSIGLPNGGLDQYLKVGLPYLAKLDTCRIASIAGETVDEFAVLAGRIGEQGGADAIEVNISCPNVKKGGLAFGTDSAATKEVTKAVKSATDLPVIVKLTPNVTSPARIARAAEAGGADMLSAVNTFLGMAVDWECAAPVLGNTVGGLSGPAIKPLALRAVWEVARAVSIPLIGVGGIVSGKDVLEFLTVGARAVQVGTASLVEPTAVERILREMEAALLECGLTSLEEVIGRLQAPGV